MGPKVKFKIASSQKFICVDGELDPSEIENGQLTFVNDRREIYLDYNGQRMVFSKPLEWDDDTEPKPLSFLTYDEHRFITGYSSTRDVSQELAQEHPEIYDDYALGVAAGAFQNCGYLVSINLPNVETIEENAFNGCWKLETVIIPSATSVAGNAFTNCGSITTLDISGLTQISNGMFQYSRRLRSLIAPNVVSVETNAFNVISIGYDTSQEYGYDLNLPNCVSIGDFAFQGNILKSINLPKCTSLGQLVFQFCNGDYQPMGVVNIPLIQEIGNNSPFRYFNGKGADVRLDSITTITSSSFFGACGNSITLPILKTIPQNTFAKGISDNYETAYTSSFTKVDCQEAETVGDDSFADYDLNSVFTNPGEYELMLPKATSIGKHAFCMRNVKSIDLSSLTIVEVQQKNLDESWGIRGGCQVICKDGTITIDSVSNGMLAYDEQKYITGISKDPNVFEYTTYDRETYAEYTAYRPKYPRTEFEPYALAEREYTYDEYAIGVRPYAFKQDSELKYIIPRILCFKNVVYLDQHAFSNIQRWDMTDEREIDISLPNVTHVEKYTFSDSVLGEVYLPSAEIIDEGAFQNAHIGRVETRPKIICESAFKNAVIGQYLFLSFGYQTETIKENAFENAILDSASSMLCRKIKNIGDYAFKNSRFGFMGLYSGENSQISIGKYAFLDCQGRIFSTNDNNGKIDIGEHAFENSSFTNIDFNTDVYLGDYAFKNCKCPYIKFSKQVELGDNVFNGCQVTSITLSQLTVEEVSSYITRCNWTPTEDCVIFCKDGYIGPQPKNFLKYNDDYLGQYQYRILGGLAENSEVNDYYTEGDTEYYKLREENSHITDEFALSVKLQSPTALIVHDWTNLTHLDLPNTQSINAPLYGCFNLVELNIPKVTELRHKGDDGTLDIDKGVFEDCQKLQIINLNSFLISDLTEDFCIPSGCQVVCKDGTITIP